MIDKIPYDVCYIAATYLSAYDLKSLTQVSPLLRDVFSPGAWNLVYVLPKWKNGAQKKLIEYIDYRFVDKVVFADVTKYQWFKRQYVHQIVFDHQCALLSSHKVESIDLDQFLNLQHIKAEVLPIYWVRKNNKKKKVKQNLRYTTLDGAVLYPDEPTRPLWNKESTVVNMEYPFAHKITSGPFHAKYTIHLMLSSIYHWNNICNHTLITKLNLTWVYVPKLMEYMTFGLRRCVNVEWLAIKVDKREKINIDTTFTQQYLNLMSVCKSLKKLRYLQASNVFRKEDPMSVFECILNDLDESVYYEYQIDVDSDSNNFLTENMETIRFPCVKALEIRHKGYLRSLTSPDSQFAALFPNLQHLSLESIRLGDYLNDMVGSFAEGLETLKVSVYMPPYMMWLVKTIPRLKRLKVLYLKDAKSSDWGSPLSLLLFDTPKYLDYKTYGARYNDLFEHILRGRANAPFEEIKTWSRDRVTNMVRSAMGKHREVENREIEYMVDLILDPEAIVTEFGSLDCFEATFPTLNEDNTPSLKYIMSYFYAVWESIFMKCQQLKELQKLTIDGIWQPFLSPNFERLVCTHHTLKRVNIRVWPKTRHLNLRQAKYSRFITRRLTPVTGYNLQKKERKINGFCYTYWVDVEGFRKQFAREIYNEGDHKDVEYTALATSEHLTIMETDYITVRENDCIHDIKEGSYRFGQEACTWDCAIHLYSPPY